MGQAQSHGPACRQTTGSSCRSHFDPHGRRRGSVKPQRFMAAAAGQRPSRCCRCHLIQSLHNEVALETRNRQHRKRLIEVRIRLLKNVGEPQHGQPLQMSHLGRFQLSAYFWRRRRASQYQHVSEPAKRPAHRRQGRPPIAVRNLPSMRTGELSLRAVPES